MCLCIVCRCKIRQWHLANTRITPRTAELLRSLPDLVFLDMRGSGVTASQLVPLRTKFSLRTPQGAVLSRSAAMALVAVSLDGFVCSQPAEHSTVARSAGAAGRGQSTSDQMQQWEQEGIAELLHARAEVEQQAVEAPEQAASAQECCAQLHPWHQQPDLAGRPPPPWHPVPPPCRSGPGTL